MESAEFIGKIERLISASKVGLLTTVDAEGYPHNRWMTPTMIKDRPNFIYAITAPNSRKAEQIRNHSQVEWTFQSTVLNEVISVKGRAVLVGDPELKSEVMEAIGPHLQIFWKVNEDSRNVVVIETEIEAVSCFYPMKNERFYREVK
ncbi:pyridoxamine 5'-phosphate oxidase family protein [Gracilinema caldarium]|uniref:Pyridoxamine 5'-phosphate oxidase-related FMN-binding protein n=1 Tax=Gracilinema caldarium (strain ATCC 51460 / DSM 7334 / H1) TaxID=744872 RepID=F8F207_GRAC1|nr:pyridoxamine 5'-phosphate oxidase family protein [Gracilinema caldarium]AEJ19854.1 pyridoxamine 5'-phosphate oxidase-related FMN-binding protein [Gracilinema caldarium DSM 7334]